MPATAAGEIFVTNNGSGTIGEYTTSGATVNASLVSGLNNPTGIAVSEGNLFVGDFHNTRIGVYTTSGTTVNASLVPGLDGPAGIAVSGGNLFVVVNQPTGGALIGEYTTAGATVNASLVSGLNSPIGIAVSGVDLFVTDAGNSRIGEYTTAGGTVNAARVSGLQSPQGIVVYGGNLYVANAGNGTIGEYTTSGATVNAALVSGLSGPLGLALFGGNLYVANAGNGTIGEYTISGATVNAALVTGLNGPWGIAVVPDSGGGTWIKTASGGLWSTPSNWSNNAIADGQDAAADFSTLNITANNTVHLDSPRTVGSLIFGDATASNNWILDDNASNGANTLTLAVSSGTPTITVINQTATISAALAGNQGLIKNGAGTLTLSGNNTFTGGVTIDDAGTLSVGSAGALNSITLNSVTFGPGSTGQLSLGGHSITIGGLNTDSNVGTPMVKNSSGTASLTVNVAANASNAYNGILQGSGTATLSLIKMGPGTQILGGSLANTFDGSVSVDDGTLVFSKSPGVLVLNGALNIGDGIGSPGSAVVMSSNSGQFPSGGVNVTIQSDGVLDFGSGVADSIHTLTMTGGKLETEGGANSSISINSFTNSLGTVSLGAGTVTVAGASSNGGVIELTDANAILAGGGTISNTGSIQGLGTVSNSVTNSGTIQAIGGILTLGGTLQNLAGGLMQTFSANGTPGTLFVTKGLASNAGTISLSGSSSLSGGTFDNNNHALTNTSQITGFGNLLTGTGGLVNNGTIEAIGGKLSITANSLQNSATGHLSASSGGTLFVTNGLLTNGGIINLTGGSFDNNGHALTNTGQIIGFGGFSTGGTGLDNKGIVTFTGGPTTVNGNVTNERTITVNSDSATFNGVVSNIMGGTINTMNNATVTFAGGFTQTGIGGIKTGSGVLRVTGAKDAPVIISPTSSLSLNQGTTIISILSGGTATIGAGVLVTISGGATLELAGSISDLSDNTNRANISNSSNAPGLLVLGMNQIVGSIDGPGTTQVNAGGSLTFNHLNGGSLIIGGTSGDYGLVTVDASDAAGNPLDSARGGPLAGGADSSGFVLAGSLVPASSFLPSSAAMSLDGSPSGSSIDGGGSLAVGTASAGSVSVSGATAVPEPSSLLLGALAVGGAIAISLSRRSKRARYRNLRGGNEIQL